MKLVCPYFKDNKCISKHFSRLKMKLSVIAICATEEHINCPIFRETVKREKEEKGSTN